MNALRFARALRALAVVTLLVMSANVSAQKIGEVQRVPPTLASQRGVVLEWTSAEGKPYWYRIPSKIDAKRPPRLIIMLHGTGLNHGWSFWNYPIAKGRFRGNDIVVSPDGLTPGGKTFNFLQGKKDGDQIAGLIESFRERFPIGEVYLYGHSQGAFFSYWFAGEHTELVDGIIAHAGNVLKVKHSDLARRKVAIGILHGEADAVVPVSCAHRTSKIYRDEKYEKVLLEIVEGLTARSGHWPLPTQVAAMFEWLDAETEATPGLAVDNALSEIAKETPSLIVVRDSLSRAQRAMKSSAVRKLSRTERKTVEGRIKSVGAFLEAAATAHSKVILSASKNKDADEEDKSAWAVHFRTVHSGLRGTKAWGKALRKIVSTAAKQESKVGKASKALLGRVDAKLFAKVVDVLEDSSVAISSTDLERQLKDVAKKNKVKGKTADKLRSILSARKKANARGSERADEVTSKVAAEFRESHGDLFGAAKK